MTDTEPEQDQDRRPGSVLDAVRPDDDRMVAGVCSGVARQLDIDPVILRVAVGVLTVVGGAGLVLYGAAWLVLPDQRSGRSVAQDHLGVDRNEPQVRGVVLVVAAVLAVASAFGLAGGGPWNTPFPYLGLAALAALWWWVARPRLRDRGTEAVAEAASGGPSGAPTLTAPRSVAPAVPRPRDPRHDRGRLTLLALLLSLVAAGVVGVWSAAVDPLPWGAYPAAMLTVLGLAMLVGTVVGNARPIVVPAILVALVLGLAAAVPYASAGRTIDVPAAAGDLDPSYTLGMGQIIVDLSDVRDPSGLLGRDLSIGNGLGDVRVVVPDGLDVGVDATTRSGEVRVFDRSDGGTGAELRVDAQPPALQITIRQTAGRVEVTRR